MNTSIYHQKLHQFIDTIDEDNARGILTLINKPLSVQDERKSLIQRERNNYMNGDKKTFSPFEVREMALNSALRNGL